jgi:hypothetical protein
MECCEYKKHRFPSDNYGSPLACRCGMTFVEHCSTEAPKEIYEHGDKRCKRYHGVRIDSFSTPRWNQGLGCFTSSVRDGEQKAKRKGLTPIGDAKLEQVFKPKDRESSRSIAEGMVRDFHKERRRCVT